MHSVFCHKESKNQINVFIHSHTEMYVAWRMLRSDYTLVTVFKRRQPEVSLWLSPGGKSEKNTSCNMLPFWRSRLPLSPTL